jgi:phosphoribosylamine--glycine ligase
MKILLIGSGGREHALAWRLALSEKCTALYCAPGNAGIEDVAECVDIKVDDIPGLISFVRDNAIDFVVVGPEGPLVAGIVDELKKINVPVFGPTKAAAQLEGSKGFTKDLCKKYGMPTAAYERFTDATKAAAFIQTMTAPIVVKADGLAAGKGVIIVQTKNEAIAAVNDMLSGHAFGDAGASVVIEEFLDGEELSFFALSDGHTVLPLTSAQDHKRVGDGDTGPNTGGMGAYSPAHMMTRDLQQKIMDRLIVPTVQGMTAEGAPFTGVLFAGIMVVGGEPYLIEYNARFGDPETQALMVRLGTDLCDLLYACATGNLKDYEGKLDWSSYTSLCVVMCANGYPGSYVKNTEIKNIHAADQRPHTKIFHAGTVKKDGRVVAAGGRVLNVVSMGETVHEAQTRAYQAVDIIDWPEGFCRRDIGGRAVAAEKGKMT